ncbi:TPA: hypothetical protein DCL30_02980 [Candidatus Peribacteria bacterium]|nr:MAG: hypothetical protein A3J91_00230 [Candidatus Peribacteria bacterium RIFOXYC2_FULL_58_10]OGJ83816.1 MAG: hypothetical protein A2529_05730 [Candidatus Peribacteria bacterium RIFOXYD2_FULL_58_15]HAI98484.1 hypothetical protein [Candidatus Peribacteria bacterium]HAS34196.1 hypothetical protein [Candidatus Peribacteria bacterium]
MTGRIMQRVSSLIVSLAIAVCAGLVLPAAFAWFLDAATPRFSPAAFNLPSMAREVVHKRTERTVTFEIAPGKFSQVSGLDRDSSPTCMSLLCSVMAPIRNLLPDVFASSEGPNGPGTVVNDASSGDNAWSDPSNATASDNAFATVTVNANVIEETFESSNYLKATNFGFTIPAASTINGVTVQVERTSNNWVLDTVVQLVVGGSIQGSNYAIVSDDWLNDYPTEETVSYGGISDTWGLTLVPSDINLSSFGVVLKLVNNTSGALATAYVDHIQITVTYTAAEDVPFFSWWSLPLTLIACAVVLRRSGILTGMNLFAPYT